MFRSRMGSFGKTGAQLPMTSKVAPNNDIKMSLFLKRRAGSPMISVFAYSTGQL